MSIPRVCAACGAVAADADTADEPFVCNACLGLPDRPAAKPKPPKPPAAPPAARRVAEAEPPPEKVRRGWPVVAGGYRQLQLALVVFLLGMLLTTQVRFFETAYKVPLSKAWFSGSALLLTLVPATVLRLLGSVGVARTPRGSRVRGLAAAVRTFAFAPVLHLIVGPLLLAVYTQAVGRETDQRGVRRGGWILLGCAVVLVPAVLWLLAAVGLLVAGLLIAYFDPMAANPRPRAPAPTPPAGDDPAAFHLLFALGAAGVLCLGAYICGMITLSGVARALEPAPPADPADSVSGTDRPADDPA